MTFEEWWQEMLCNSPHPIPSQFTHEQTWEAAFDEGVKWTLQQDANTLNKLQLTLEEE